MTLSALTLRQQSRTQVATREDAVNFANAALAQRTYSGDPLKDFSTDNRALAHAKFNAAGEYWRLCAERGLTRQQATNAIRLRDDLAKPLMDADFKITKRNLDYLVNKCGGSLQDKRPPQRKLVYELCRNYAKGAAQRIGQHALPADFMSEFMRAYMNQNRMLVSPAYRAAAQICRAKGVTDIPAEHKVRNFLVTRVSKRAMERGRINSGQYEDTLTGYIMRDWNCEVGEVWVGDHRILDVWVKVWDEKKKRWVAQRPWITAWMDVKSGFIVAAVIYVDSYPNHRKILEALYLAIITNGYRPPAKLITDNGKDYLKKGACRDARLQPLHQPTRGANRFNTLVEETLDPSGEYRHSVLRELNIEHITSRPYAGRQKPIERRFRDFSQGFDKLWPGYTGNCPATRPEYGQDFGGNPEQLPTNIQLVVAFRDWLADYHDRPNNSRITGGRPPRELWDARAELTAALTPEQLDWAMLVPYREPLMVRRGPGGCNVWYQSWPYGGETPDDCLTLRKYDGQQVMIKTSWAPEGTFEFRGKALPDRLWIFTLDGKFICNGRAEVEIPVFNKTPEQKEELSRAMQRIAVIRKADRTERDTLRERKIAVFPAQKLFPVAAAGNTAPELEDGIQPSQLNGGGKGRARKPSEALQRFHDMITGGQTDSVGDRQTAVSPEFRAFVQTRRAEDDHEENWQGQR